MIEILEELRSSYGEHYLVRSLPWKSRLWDLTCQGVVLSSPILQLIRQLVPPKVKTDKIVDSHCRLLRTQPPQMERKHDFTMLRAKGM